MSDLLYFGFENAAVRVVKVDGEPWFVGKDVADMLGYRNPQKAVRDHCRRPKSVGVNKSFTPSDLDPQTVIIPEADVMRLIVSSKLPAAERFERWVFEEVLPSIRKTGSYQTGALPPALTKYRPVEPGREYFPIHWALVPPPQGPSVTLDSRNIVRVWRLINYFRRVYEVCNEFKVGESLENMGSPAGMLLSKYLLDGRMLGVDGLERELGPIIEAARIYGRDVLGFKDLAEPIE